MNDAKILLAKHCVYCSEEKHPESFSKSQWKGKATTRKCISCIFNDYKARSRAKYEEQKEMIAQKEQENTELLEKKKQLEIAFEYLCAEKGAENDIKDLIFECCDQKMQIEEFCLKESEMKKIERDLNLKLEASNLSTIELKRTIGQQKQTIELYAKTNEEILKSAASQNLKLMNQMKIDLKVLMNDCRKAKKVNKNLKLEIEKIQSEKDKLEHRFHNLERHSLEELKKILDKCVGDMCLVKDAMLLKIERERVCEICMDHDKSHALLCGHQYCGTCCDHMKNQNLYHCPICRKQSEHKIKLFC